jgi:head-tail adaptor
MVIIRNIKEIHMTNVKQHARLLNERIVLLSKQSVADEFGKMKVVYLLEEKSWARIEPIHRTIHKYIPMITHQNVVNSVYKVLIRERSDLERQVANADRHLKINALRWKGEEYELLCPFAALDVSWRFWYALCTGKGEAHG